MGVANSDTIEFHIIRRSIHAVTYSSLVVSSHIYTENADSVIALQV